MPAPIKHTCPDINKLQKKIDQCRKDIRYMSKNTEDSELIRDLDGIEDVLLDLDRGLEDLRGSNDALRSYGEEQEKRADDLENELAEAIESSNKY